MEKPAGKPKTRRKGEKKDTLHTLNIHIRPFNYYKSSLMGEAAKWCIYGSRNEM